ncbi:YggT family protein [Stella humosa]|uniref:YggT family protein n=1 Tax=Stella humosa TaxID=94 RepID=A0A3N1L3Q2_9PROT|nr:YggT family protein [Stella humosa]ROP84035.1 YggT family protein [Stella humosa]BBK33546.1 membrane protein [Stella humosa]
MNSLLHLLTSVIDIYMVILIAAAIMSWLFAFGIVNTRNRAVEVIAELLYRLTEPALRPIRRILPRMGGIDLSPIVLILLLQFLRNLLVEYFPR